jgi:hypothetical protein
MTSGNPELRAELHHLTIPPKGTGIEWLDVQIQQMDELNKRLPHSVPVHTPFSLAIYELNCFMFALDIDPRAVSDMCLGPVFPGKKFVQFLLAHTHLRERTAQEGSQDGDIVIYFRNGVPEHAGRLEASMVISKWGSEGTHIWQHALWDVPAIYGDEAGFFAPLPTAVAIYRAWAADQGL